MLLFKGFLIRVIENGQRLETKFAVSNEGIVLTSGKVPFSNEFGKRNQFHRADVSKEWVSENAQFCGNYSLK